MKKLTIPITNCHVNCMKCRMPIEFKLFESGLAGDFETVYGKNTKTYYRIDLGSTFYLKKSHEELLSSIVQIEGDMSDLVLIPAQLNCKFCGNKYINDSIMIDSEEIIEAVIVD